MSEIIKMIDERETLKTKKRKKKQRQKKTKGDKSYNKMVKAK